MTLNDPAVLAPIVCADPTSNPAKPRRPYLDLFLISFLILFFELAAIRWFGSTVVFLTFFTNIVLLACFLGMSVGLLTASRRQNFIRWVIPLTFISILLAMATFYVYMHTSFGKHIAVTVGNQTHSPQIIYFGTEYRHPDLSQFVVPLWIVAGVFFSLIAITFIGLGQTMGRAFDAIPNRVLAYTTDVLGSLTGIALFALMSFLKLSPHNWFILIVLLLLYFVKRWSVVQIIGVLGIMFLISLSAYGVGEHGQLFWSPYYKIAYTPQTGEIETNNIAHQQMLNIGPDGSGYALPHLLNRDAGNEPFKDVMIIGAGSGNDVAAALRYGASHIDAVEIDPVINQIGRWDHPNQPYSDPRVTVHLDDGRAFMRKTKQKYDLAIYALVDSLVLHSGYTSLRLENFLFTQQAMEDVKKTLKPGGVFAMYNYFRQGWVVARLKTMAKKVFGVDPIIISLPAQKPGETILPWDNEANFRTFILVGTDSKKLEAIRKQFESKQNFWINWKPQLNDHINGYSPTAPLGDESAWQRLTMTAVATTQPANLASLSPDKQRACAALANLPQDNWPQLYLENKAIPWAPNGHGMLVVAVMSLIILLVFTWPVWFAKTGFRGRPSGQMFFLGAGFMLLETKGVVHMALLFGSTWVVNSVVFFAILVMILIANLFVLGIKPQKLWAYYALLVATLLVNALVPMDWFLSFGLATRTIVSCAVVFVPIFFAGVIFTTVFRDSVQPDIDFGSNIAGIILGGLSEQLSLVIGFNYLLLIAIVYYALSAIPRRRAPIESAPPVAKEEPIPA